MNKTKEYLAVALILVAVALAVAGLINAIVETPRFFFGGIVLGVIIWATLALDRNSSKIEE